MKKRNRFLAAFIAVLTLATAVCIAATPISAASTMSAMTFEPNGTGTVVSTGTTYGKNTRDYTDCSVEITYAETTNMKYSGVYVNYLAKLAFVSPSSDFSSSNTYARVLYSAEMPAGESCVMAIKSDGSGNYTNINTSVTDTNGAYVLTAPVALHSDVLDRFANGDQNSLMFSATSKDCVFNVKAVYFFANESDATAFTPLSGGHSITINGNNISLYQIVIAEDAPLQVRFAAESFASHVKDLTGTPLNVVTDKEAETDFEILFGKSNRANSYEAVLGSIDCSNLTTDDYKNYAIKIIDNTLVLTAHIPDNMTDCTNYFLETYLYKGQYTNIPQSITLPKYSWLPINYTGSSSESSRVKYYYDNWTKPENVDNPEIFSDKFSKDNGYFMEENNASDFTIENGVMRVSTYDLALTYLHLYETNAIFAADFTYDNAGENGDFGIMLRYNDALAWVKAGYDFEEKVWYIDSRDGMDFYRFRLASKNATLTEGETYKLELSVDGTSATLSLAGTPVVTTTALTHLSPGRAAIFAEDVDLTIDNAELTMRSGQGKLMNSVTHNVLPTNKYTEGGTVLMRKDNETATYLHHYGYVYNSTDGGKTWVDDTVNQWIEPNGYYNVIRLENGNLLQIGSDADGYKHSYIYSENGDSLNLIATGDICAKYYGGDTTLKAVSSNVNDKLFQSPTTGRIFYCQNYQAPNPPGTGLDGYVIFCRIYYSDDGINWTKSQTTTMDMTFYGENTKDTFGECKVLEYLDEEGNSVIRLYTSYNKFDCIVYSDSFDGGVTFNPVLTELLDKDGNGFPCSTSSMQFVRDPFAENDHTYYMVWVDNFEHTYFENTRCGLSIARSEDGVTWERLGTLWRWESTYSRTTPAINHIVDPFIQVTEDTVICGAGISDGILANADGGEEWHNGQRQHIYSIPKTAFDFVPEEETEVVTIVASSEYGVIGSDSQLVMIETDENNASYTYTYTVDGDETDYDFYYSDKYRAYVALLPADIAEADIYDGLVKDETGASDEIAYDGDVNGDGRVTAGDAALVSAMLYNPDNSAYTVEMRLKADYLSYGDFVTADDCMAILYAAVGLTYTPAN